jgi:hypothetical protein
VERTDGVGVGAIEHTATVATDVNETDILEDAEVLGDRGLLEAESVHDIRDGTFAESEKGKDVAAARFGDGVESVGGCGSTRHV